MLYPEIPSSVELKALRVRNGLENWQAANLINVNLSTWTRYEAGELTPSQLNWALLLNAVGELNLPADNPLSPLARRALSFVPPVALKAGNQREGYKPPTPTQITKLRKKAGLSRLQCNELMGFKSQAHWGKFERGEITIAEREWVIFQVAIGAINPPEFSDFETAKNRKPLVTTRPKTAPSYIPPTAAEIYAFLEKHNLTQAQAAACIGIAPRTFRNYLTGKKLTHISESAWKILQGAVNEREKKLAENPDNKGFVKPKEITSEKDFQAAFDFFAVEADNIKKQNKKRSKNFEPTHELQFIVKTVDDDRAALFYRAPDYFNDCWTMWKGFTMEKEALNKMLAALSKRLGAIEIKFE